MRFRAWPAPKTASLRLQRWRFRPTWKVQNRAYVSLAALVAAMSFFGNRPYTTGCSGFMAGNRRICLALL